MRSDFQHLLVQQVEGVVTITMNRPEVLNAFNDLMVQEFIEVVEAVAQDAAVRCVVINGAGRAFGAGQDLAVFLAEHNQSALEEAKAHLQHYHRLVQAIQTMPKPVIASIHGAAAGVTLNVALACDLRIASEDASFTEAFVRIGLVPDGGGAYFLPRLIGFGKAMEMMLLAQEIKGPEAERLGLIAKCVPRAELESATHALAQRLASGPTRTYALIKEQMYAALDSNLQGVLELEGKFQALAIETADHQEGVAAFLQKRRPKYSGQ